MVYISKQSIDKQDFDRINRLLNEINFNDKSKNMECIIDELNAMKDSWETGFQFKFENNAEILIDIRSGQHNYFDDVLWQQDDEEELLDCSYTLDEKNEYFIGDDVYICEFIIK